MGLWLTGFIRVIGKEEKVLKKFYRYENRLKGYLACGEVEWVKTRGIFC